MMSVKKNGAVIGVITLLLCVAVYLNWSYSREQSVQTGVDEPKLSDQVMVSVDAGSDADRFAENQWKLHSGSGSDASAESEPITVLSDYFAQTRLDRQQSRDEAMSLYQSTLADEQSSEQARADAEAAVSALAARTVSESRIESLVVAKGFVECVAIMDDETINVVVQPKEAGLIGTDVAKIKDIILAETDYTTDKIRVMEAP